MICKKQGSLRTGCLGITKDRHDRLDCSEPQNQHIVGNQQFGLDRVILHFDLDVPLLLILRIEYLEARSKVTWTVFLQKDKLLEVAFQLNFGLQNVDIERDRLGPDYRVADLRK